MEFLQDERWAASLAQSDTLSGESADDILQRDQDHLIPVYARYPVVMDRGEGCYLFDIEGNRYLDMMGGLGVNALGHAHPRMVSAMVDQASRMVHLSPQYSNLWPGLLAQKLSLLAGLPGVFFSTGGSEAVEGALEAGSHAGPQGGRRRQARHGRSARFVPRPNFRIAFRYGAGQVFHRFRPGAARCPLYRSQRSERLAGCSF